MRDRRTEARVAGGGGCEAGGSGEVVDGVDVEMVAPPLVGLDESAAIVCERLGESEEGVDDGLQALVDGLHAVVEGEGGGGEGGGSDDESVGLHGALVDGAGEGGVDGEDEALITPYPST